MISKNILITGATGMIGTRLTELLIARGHDVRHLGRGRKSGPVKSFVWDVEHQAMDARALQDVDTIIHLAGAGIADERWTEKRKTEILESRTQSTKLLRDTLERETHAVKCFVCASAIGYYGFANTDKVFTERDESGTDFLADVTRQWEAEADKITSMRVVKIRTGIALTPKGGTLKAMARPINLFVGAPLGSGNQYISWIHIDDLCRIFIHAAEEESLVGPYNAVSLQAVTNCELTKALANALHRPLLLPPVPGFALRLVLGEMASLVLNGSKVSSEKIRATGFGFQFDNLQDALRNLYPSG